MAPTLKLDRGTLESGAVDFKALAEETRRKLQNSFEKGQALGNARKTGTSKAKPTRGTRSKK
ncbi:hypothetical protein [Deinococcus apachensis]|uniref:hypothetical protein n=1 Tax=Deinococcus apachensis TaxID=309886 RepID=UPI00036732FC|nr:hypothetical protein [Deinococcus apachensis]